MDCTVCCRCSRIPIFKLKTATACPSGQHNVTVYTKDVLGNSAISRAIYFMVMFQELLQKHQHTLRRIF